MATNLVVQRFDVVELKGLLAEHGRQDVVRVVHHAEPLDQAFLPARQLPRDQQVLLVAGVERFLQVLVL